MKIAAVLLLFVYTVRCQDDDLLTQLAADLRKILEDELALPVKSQQTDEELQSIEGSGNYYGASSSDPIDVKKTALKTMPTSTVTPPTTTTTTRRTTTTTPQTTTTAPTTNRPSAAPPSAKPTTTKPTAIRAQKIHPHSHPKLPKICVAEAECLSDVDCGSKGRCFGTHLGKCNCRACVPARNCSEDVDCGGLRGACHLGECHCERALSTHGFPLMVDALLHFCDQKRCKAHGNECHGLPCHVGNCRCTGNRSIGTSDKQWLHPKRLLVAFLMFSRLLIFLAIVCASQPFRLQGVAVKGRLWCGEVLLRNTKVKIYDIDTNPGDPDDLLDEKYTDAQGEFRLDGTTRELTDIDPVLYIYHDCLDDIRPCQKEVTFTIPKHYIHHGKATKWFDIGGVNLETDFPGQGRSCNH